MIALIICIVGLVVYLLTEGKPSESGRIAFAIGLAFTLLTFGGKSIW